MKNVSKKTTHFEVNQAVAFQMFGIVSSCAIVTLSLTGAVFFDIRLNVVTLKTGSEITQGHGMWDHSKDCVWFPISVL